MKKLLYILIIAIIVLLGVAVNTKMKQPATFGYSEMVVIQSGVTNSSVALNPSVVTSVLSPNTARVYSLICNDDTTNIAYLHVASATTSVAVSEGVRLGVGDCYEIGVNNLYIGQVYGISAATTTLTIIEK